MYTPSLLTGALALLSSTVTTVSAAALTQVSNYASSNPTNTEMYIYVPDKLAANPPIIVAVHHCDGSGPIYYGETPYAQLADQYGFIVIYPSTLPTLSCWDVSSQSTLTHNGGGDSNAIANMVTYTLNKYNADASRVYVTGSSSGAMMTNVMAATYPELFKAATAYSGVPAGCFVSSSNQVAAWNATCAQGQIDASPQYWATVAENMYPGYSGSRPRFQVYHGSIDTTLLPPNYNETVKQWTGVFGYNYQQPQKVENNFPQSGYTTDIWGIDAENPLGTVQGIYALNVGHTVPVNGTQDLMWFGLGPYTSDYGSTGGSTTTSTTSSKAVSTTLTTATTSKTSVTTTSSAPSSCATKYGQCGGSSYTGPTCCAAGSTCTFQNAYYSQCL